ncbi:MAG: hypothetical protein RQ826_17235 [Xanthomonadales bacterium]|nr:hypothetical protein [Xanthomonadales bacterium]
MNAPKKLYILSMIQYLGNGAKSDWCDVRADMGAMMIKLLLVVLGVYGALMLLIFLLQPRLVFLPHVPGRELLATPMQIGLSV